MRKLLALLLLCIFCASAPAAGKVLVLTSAYAQASGYQDQIRMEWDRIVRSCGIECDLRYATDTAFINSIYPDSTREGDYSMCVLLNLPAPGATTDTESELAALGWPRLAAYLNRSHPDAFPIPLLVLIPAGPSTSGCWGYSGYMGFTATSIDYQPITDAAGDSIYVNGHFNTSEFYRVADSTSWCDAMLWIDATPPSAGQKYATVWRTVGTGDHQVIWIPYASFSYLQFAIVSIVAAFEPITPLEIPVIIRDYGYVNSAYFGTSVDTVGFGYNLNRLIKDDVVPHDIKIDFLVDTYQMKTQNKTNIRTLETLAAAYPDNVRMTHWTLNAWGNTGNYDWLGYSNSASYLQMTRRIGRSLDSTDVYMDVDRDRLAAHYSAYPGYGGAKLDSAILALDASDVTKCYMRNVSEVGSKPPYSSVYGMVNAERRFTPSGDELCFYPIGLSYDGSFEGAVSAAAKIDTNRIYYLNLGTEYEYARGTISAQQSKAIIGEYYYFGGTSYNLSSDAQRLKTIRSCNFTPGMSINAGIIGGGSVATYPAYAGVDSTRSIVRDCVRDARAHKDISDYIIETYGTQTQSAFIWAWNDEVKFDRRHGNAWPNSHVRHE